MTPTESDPIVVTGMGAVTPLGVGVATNWERLIASRSGIRRNDRFDVSALSCQIAGLVPQRPRTERLRSARFRRSQGHQEDGCVHPVWAGGGGGGASPRRAGGPTTRRTARRPATIIAIGRRRLSGDDRGSADAQRARRRGGCRRSSYRRFSPTWRRAGSPSAYGFKGPLGAPVTACAAAAQAIGDGMRLIRTGEAEVAVVGGAEGSIDPVTRSAASPRPGRWRPASTTGRPRHRGRSTRRRDGFVLAEGAAVLVIERLSHALARGASRWRSLAGYGTSADAYHLTASPPDGAGRAACHAAGDEDGRRQPGRYRLHQRPRTSTQVGRRRGDRRYRRRVRQSRQEPGDFGHQIGDRASAGRGRRHRHDLHRHGAAHRHAAGDAQPRRPRRGRGCVRPRAKTARAKEVAYALVNAFGFGGVNASLLLRKV